MVPGGVGTITGGIGLYAIGGVYWVLSSDHARNTAATVPALPTTSGAMVHLIVSRLVWYKQCRSNSASRNMSTTDMPLHINKQAVVCFQPSPGCIKKTLDYGV